MDLAEKIKQKAFELGFHKIGFARAEILTEELEFLKAWLSKGFHGEMKWLEKEPEKRADPKQLFPEVKTVICAAMNYYTPYEYPKQVGKISRYAWGEDYHEVLKKKLHELLAYIKTLDERAEGKVCVDTSPILEKAWAVKAGLGWIGKHTNLITKEYGSWVFLGEILINLEISDSATIETDHCGNCRACIDACPTNAISEPYQLNASLCISYATIELRKAEIPETISKKLEGWFYGCDICQEVCPWNRFQKPTEQEAFKPRANTIVDLEEILSMDEKKYAERFRRSAMKRAKLHGLKRNAKALKSNVS
ncbi:MAG: tRNA epoxyqueuosine(34) reductase QueG [Pyrinomonadaceae bacterium]|nr:tRNA epoxyqueuosine(34) reductase QueG [Pyrinomonadaceae bacterium]MCX7638967.1 tRNA epoxyqueuosine(34) reductase QueG [Pyrinomonadaceae bacterium]MDW8303814.1 tRNA epoxyqueuosine(34) reductase QueG [Acidobacteriota bacterium]